MNHVCRDESMVACGVPGCDVWKCVQCIADHYRECPSRINRLFSLAYNKQHDQILSSGKENGSIIGKDSRREKESCEYLTESVSQSDR